MPSISINHEPRCNEHLGPDAGLDEICTAKMAYFGPPMPTRPGESPDPDDRRGSLHVQLSENELEPVALVTWAPMGHGQITLGALKALRDALVTGGFDEVLRAIDESLEQMEATVPA